ncbi:MAG: GAF domain-containing protein [Candidatus Eremiobacteraeota bacterium]|nr:GAF domain-containing protein [Candidatus Eremiobacteraeota bacterium]
MNATTTPPRQDAWSLLHDLIFSVPHAVLTALACATAVVLLAALVLGLIRIWRGDRVELGPFKIERPDMVESLQGALEGLSKDDKLKANVLWMFRDRLSEANRIVGCGIEREPVREWCAGILTDALTALSDGGHDRHRASLWVRAGDGMCMYSGLGFRQEALDRATLPLHSIAGNVVRTGTSHTTSDVRDDQAFAPKPRSGRQYRSLLTVPVKTPGGDTIAALCVDAEVPGYFDRDHVFFAECFADLIALLLAQVVIGEPA